MERMIFIYARHSCINRYYFKSVLKILEGHFEKCYPDRPFRRIVVNYGNLRSRMVGLWFWYNNFYNLPF